MIEYHNSDDDYYILQLNHIHTEEITILREKENELMVENESYNKKILDYKTHCDMQAKNMENNKVR